MLAGQAGLTKDKVWTAFEYLSQSISSATRRR